MGRSPRKSKSEWQTLIEEQKASDETIVQFCKSRGLSTTAFYNKRASLFKNTQDTASFKSVTVASQSNSGKIRCGLPCGLQLEWDQSISSTAIVSLIRALS